MYTAEDYFNQGSGIVTICGSTRFFFEAMECNRILTFKNWMVFMSGSWGHSFHKFDKSEKERNYEIVKKLHFQKILRSQAIVIVTDTSGYIGNSTKAEEAFANYITKTVTKAEKVFTNYSNIPVFYFDGINFSGKTDIKPPDLNGDTSLIDNFAQIYGGLGF